MKIVQIISSLGMGGAEVMCENLVYELRAVGCDVTLVSLFSTKTPITERLEARGVDVRYLDKHSGLDLSMKGKLRRLLRELRPDIVHTHLNVTKYVFSVARKLGIPVVHTVHNVAKLELPTIERRINRYYFRRSYAYPVALSHLVQETVCEEYSLPEACVAVVENGIDLSHCKPKTSYEASKPFRLLHIGRFFKQKNHIGMLQAFADFHSRYPDTELHLVGDGGLRPSIESFIREHGLTESVKLWGVQPHAHEHLHNADLFTLPSEYEGLPITLIEAMGTGLPIVATAVGGVPDMLDSDSAILTPVDTKAVADAWERYYLDESLRRRHGETALACSERFSSVTMAASYIRLYNETLASKA